MALAKRKGPVHKAYIRTNVRKDDTVKVMTGADRGKEGRVLEIDRIKNRVLVEGVRIIKRHVRPNPQRQIKGGIAESEAFFALSNVMVVCPSCGPVRTGMRIESDGSKTRVCKKCDNPLES